MEKSCKDSANLKEKQGVRSIRYVCKILFTNLRNRTISVAKTERFIFCDDNFSHWILLIS